MSPRWRGTATRGTRHPAFFYVVWLALFVSFVWMLSHDHGAEFASFIGLVLSLIVGDWFVIRWSERGERKGAR